MPSSPRVATRRLAAVLSFAALAGSAPAADFIYTPVDSDTDLWSTGANWSATPVSGADTRLTFVADNATVLPDGFGNTSTNDIAGAFQLNILDLRGTGPETGSASIGIAGAVHSTGLELVANGETDPTINLEAEGPDGALGYTISTPIQLEAVATRISGNGTASFNFSGGFTATERATLFKTGSSVVHLGTTSVNNIDIGRNTEGGAIVMNAGSALTVGMGFENAELTIGFAQNIGGSPIHATLDASATTSFTANVGTIRVGNMTQANGGAEAIAELNLGADNDLTAGNRVIIGYSQSAFPQAAFQGTVTTADGGQTILRSPRMTIGGNKARGQFVAGADSTVTFTGIDSGRMNLEVGIIGEDTVSGSGSWGGTADFSNATFIGELGSVIIGHLEIDGNTASTTGTLLLGDSAANRLDVSAAGTAMAIGRHVTGSGKATGVVTIGNLDASSVIESLDNGTAILLGDGGATPEQANGTLNLNGGTLELRTTGAGIRGGTGTSTVNFNGMTLRAGASSTNWITGVTTANLGAGGARIDTNGFDVGSDQIFSGTGGLVKLGAGDLRLSGASTFSGATVVEAGTLTIAEGGMLSSENIQVLDSALHLTVETADAFGHGVVLSLAGGGVAGEADAGALNLLADAAVSGLILDGELFGEGTYGSTLSDATFKNDEFFSGEGVLTVVPEPATVALLSLGACFALAAVRGRRRDS